MKDILICMDKNSPNFGDIDISSKDISLNGDEKQKVFIRMRTFKGEWFLDQNYGVPYIQIIFQKGTSKENIDTIIKQQIIDCLSVNKIRNFKSNINKNTSEYSFSCDISNDIIEGDFIL
jgi:hypothetical protein